MFHVLRLLAMCSLVFFCMMCVCCILVKITYLLTYWCNTDKIHTDCQLITAIGRRRLRSSNVATCDVPRTRTSLGDGYIHC